MTGLPSSSRPVVRSDRSVPQLAVGAAISLVGALLVVAGTFLPWVTSGGVQRNSYAVLGIVHRLAFLDGGPAAAAIALWPLLGTVAMVPVIAGILRWWRTAAVTSLSFGVLTGVGALGVLVVAAGHQAAGIALSTTGPAVTIAGAALAVLGAVFLLAARRRRRTQWPTTGNRHVLPEPTGGPVRRNAHSATPQQFPRRPPHRPDETADSSTAVATERKNAG